MSKIEEIPQTPSAPEGNLHGYLHALPNLIAAHHRTVQNQPASLIRPPPQDHYLTRRKNTCSPVEVWEPKIVPVVAEVFQGKLNPYLIVTWRAP